MPKMRLALKTAALAAALFIAGSNFAISQDDRFHDRDDYRVNEPALRIAHDLGYEDGTTVARQDLYHRKAFEPYPRGRYSREDHGYRPEYGDRYAYREQYANGYERGYERTYRRY